MKLCISLRDPAGPNLRDSNFRSEPRWERLALEASISNPEVKEIYTSGYEWVGGKDVTSKYKGVITKQEATNCILVIQDWNTSVINSKSFKAIVVNIFHGPWIEQKREIEDATARYRNNVFFVMGHPVLYNDELCV